MRILLRGMQDLGVDVQLEYLGNLRSPLDLYKARQTVRELSAGYDVVHAQFGSACAFACATAQAPKVLSLRGSDWHVYKGSHLGLRIHNELAKWLSQISLKHYDEIVVMSDRMREEVSRFSPKASIHVIPDAVDDAFLVSHERKASRVALGEPNNETPWVLFTTVSVDNPVKRANLALEAIEHLRSKGLQVELRVASGIAPADMPVFVSSCNLVLCTSTHEGWPNSVKEALACGLPFVSTDVSDLRAIANQYPSCRVVDADPIAISDAISRVLDIKEPGALKDSVRHMSVENICNRLKACYDVATQSK